MVCQRKDSPKMAFLCPVRFKRAKRKKARDLGGVPLMGRITGSASIDTLVRVGLEKEDLFVSAETAKHPTMVVIHDFQPCVEDELSVVKGTKVTVLYRDNDWVYVLADDGREGFVPHAYCMPLSLANDESFAMTSMAKPSRPAAPPDYENVILIRNRAGDVTDVATYGELRRQTSLSLPSLQEEHPKPDKTVPHQATTPKTEPFDDSQDSTESYQSFEKQTLGRYIVLFNFVAQQENDTSVDRGEFVTLLNKDDPEWFWVMRSDRREGFVPRIFLCPADGQGETGESSHQPLIPTRSDRGVGTTPGLLTNGQQPIEAKQMHSPQPMHSPPPSLNRPYPSTSSPKPAVSRSGMSYTHSTLPRSFRPKDIPAAKNFSQEPRSHHETSFRSSFSGGRPNGMNGHTSHLYGDNEMTSSQRSLQRALENGQNGYNSKGVGHIQVHQQYPMQNSQNIFRGSSRSLNSQKPTQTAHRISADQTVRHSYAQDIPSTPKPSNRTDKELLNSPTYVTMTANPVASAYESEYVKSRSGAIRAVCLYDFQAKGPDDLTVARGDIIFIASDTNVNKPHAKWLWVYSPASRRAGYVPSVCIRRPDQPSPPSQNNSRQNQKPHLYHQSPTLASNRPRDPYMSP